jgi:hypothetical protein
MQLHRDAHRTPTPFRMPQRVQSVRLLPLPLLAEPGWGGGGAVQSSPETHAMEVLVAAAAALAGRLAPHLRPATASTLSLICTCK